MSSYYTYIAHCADGSLYTGYCRDIAQRELQHNQGKGAKYTRSRRPIQIIYQEGFVNRSEAQKREAALKKLTRAQKIDFLSREGVLLSAPPAQEFSGLKKGSGRA